MSVGAEESTPKSFCSVMDSSLISIDAFCQPTRCRAYIYHRLAQATTQVETVFTFRALTRIIKAAQGVPATLNILCTNALIAGFWAQQRPVSAKAAREAIAQVQSPSPSQLRRWES